MNTNHLKQNSTIKKRIALALFIVAIGLGSFLRFKSIHSFPGLEHDEALICSGALSIADNVSFPLTGDKVYEGPLLEYFLGLSWKIFGVSVANARISIASLNLLGLCLLFLILARLMNPLTGGIIALIAATHPWLLSVSRVIYACNLSFITITLFLLFLFRFYISQKKIWLLLAGISLGLAMHGRITAGIFFLPAIILIFQTKGNNHFFHKLGIFSIPLCLITLPLIVYNALNDWPVFNIWISGSQGHFIGSDAVAFQYFHRIWGFLLTFIRAINGSLIWLDFPFFKHTMPGAFVWLVLAGLIITLFTRSNIYRQFIILSFFLPIILIPLLTKHLVLPNGQFAYHPHYLDLIMPQAFILSGIAVGHLLKLRYSTKFKASILTLLVCYISFNQLYVASKTYKQYKLSGGPGRWHRGYQEAAEIIKNKFSASQYKIIMDWTFSRGYPQMKFLLNNYHVSPFIGTFHGIHNQQNQLIPGNVLTVANTKFIQNPSWKIIETLNIPDHPFMAILEIQSPGIYIDTSIINKDLSTSHVNIRGNLAADGQDCNGKIEFDTNEIIEFSVLNRQDSFCELPALTSLVEKVTPRHRSEIQYLSQFPCRFELDGVTSSGNSVRFIWEQSPSGWKIQGNVSGKLIDGFCSGEIFFY